MVCIVPNKQSIDKIIYKNKFITVVEKYRINGLSFGLTTNAVRFSRRVVYFYKLPIFSYNKIIQIV